MRIQLQVTLVGYHTMELGKAYTSNSFDENDGMK
jgi:hypothetical protein